MPSRSRPGEFYSTDIADNTCPCEDAQLNKEECWHIRQLKAAYKAYHDNETNHHPQEES